MNCSDMDVYVSAICDSEPIPEDAAGHIAACGVCRETLNGYTRMGAELRLSAAAEPARLTPLVLPARESPLDFLWRRVAVPRFALAALIVCVIAALVVTSTVRAQSNPLWFEFGYSPHGESFHYFVAKAGFDDTTASLDDTHGVPLATALRVKVQSVASDEVVLQVRAVPARMEVTATGVKLLGGPIKGVSLAGVPSVHYKPGERLAILVEGGGTLYLKGDVLDHQPKLAFGTPLVPTEDKMMLRAPALLGSDKLITSMGGSFTIADASGVAWFGTPEGTFWFGLKPFPGAVQGNANWGEVSFKLEGKNYRLLAAAPITGGDQPRPVWVRHDLPSERAPACERGCLGSSSAPMSPIAAFIK